MRGPLVILGMLVLAVCGAWLLGDRPTPLTGGGRLEPSVELPDPAVEAARQDGPANEPEIERAVGPVDVPRRFDGPWVLVVGPDGQVVPDAEVFALGKSPLLLDDDLETYDRVETEGIPLLVDDVGRVRVDPDWPGVMLVGRTDRLWGVRSFYLNRGKFGATQEKTLRLRPRRALELSLAGVDAGLAGRITLEVERSGAWWRGQPAGDEPMSVPHIDWLADADGDGVFADDVDVMAFVDGRLVLWRSLRDHELNAGRAIVALPPIGTMSVRFASADGSAFGGPVQLWVESNRARRESHDVAAGEAATIDAVADGERLTLVASPVSRSHRPAAKEVTVALTDGSQEAVVYFDHPRDGDAGDIALTGPPILLFTLTDESGAPLTEVTLKEWNSTFRDGRYEGVVADSAGRFRWRAEAESGSVRSYRLRAWVEERGSNIGFIDVIGSQLLLSGDNDIGAVTVMPATEVARGVVVDELGEPVKGVPVRYSSARSVRRCETDHLGRFTLFAGEEPSRRYTPQVELDGYRSRAIGPTDGEWRVVMLPELSVTGAIELGDIPSDQVRVRVRRGRSGGYLKLDDAGRFEIILAGRGSVRLEVLLRTQDEPLIVLPAVEPGATELSLSIRDRASVATIQVVDQAGDPVAGALVRVGHHRVSTSTDADGKARVVIGDKPMHLQVADKSLREVWTTDAFTGDVEVVLDLR